MIATPGPLLFARYAYPPNALGLCGADVRRTLLEYGAAGESDGGLAELARTFEGAWPYLELIAGANGIADPLDPRVVEAYWVGNELLDRVRPGRPRPPRRRPLPRPARPRARARRRRGPRRAPSRTTASTSSPSTRGSGSCAPGIVDEPLRILDQCRTTPARVVSVDGETVDRPRPAAPLRERPAPARRPGRARRARWRTAGLAFVAAPVAGDLVSLHWDFVCDVLTPAAARALERATRRALRPSHESRSRSPRRRRRRSASTPALTSTG